MKKNEIVLFESKDGSVALPVSVESETVWLSLAQMGQLFGKDKSVVFRHVKNAVSEGEIDPEVTSAKFAMVTPHGAIPGKTREQMVDCYNLDVIISVGYRVKSQRGVEFRRWATSVLKDYLVKGAAVNRKRLSQLDQTVKIMKRVGLRKNAAYVTRGPLVLTKARVLGISGKEVFDKSTINGEEGWRASAVPRACDDTWGAWDLTLERGGIKRTVPVCDLPSAAPTDDWQNAFSIWF